MYCSVLREKDSVKTKDSDMARDAKQPKQSQKRTKVEDSHFLIPKLPPKPQ